MDSKARTGDERRCAFNRNRTFKMKQLVRSQAIKESQSPPRVPSPRSFEIYDHPESRSLLKTRSASVDSDYANLEIEAVLREENTFKNKKCGEEPSSESTPGVAPPLVVPAENAPERDFPRSSETAGLAPDGTPSNKDYDCGIGPSLEIEEYEESTEDDTNVKRRATCASKQDSGVCCWDLCNCCGDVSPEITFSDAEDEGFKIKKRGDDVTGCDGELQDRDEVSGLSDRGEKWSRRGASTLGVRPVTGANPRLMRKQSSGGGSVDSGQHSLVSPHSSRDGSMEVTSNCWDVDVPTFIKDTLNKGSKDRQILLKLEEELIGFIKDPSSREIRFPAPTSYGRLLVHRCADLFGMRHVVDSFTKNTVVVTKVPQVNYKIPTLCPLQQWCSVIFANSPLTHPPDDSTQAKSILKRDTHSLDEEPHVTVSEPVRLLRAPKSKSFEQREEEYVKARQRIFNSSDQSEIWPSDEPEEECKSKISSCDVKNGRCLLKVQSMEHSSSGNNVRGLVLKAHSFGGYGGRLGVQRGDSTASNVSAPPHRVLSRQGEMASNWKLSPCSSGYKTLSGRSDSITPSPTSTPNTVTLCPKKTQCSGIQSSLCLSEGDEKDKNMNRVEKSAYGNVLWAITDVSNVPIGAIIIHPQTGQALTNPDGTLYHYDPTEPLHDALKPCPQATPEHVRVLSNPERRRSRLEKQRATLSPGVDTEPTSMNTSTKSTSCSSHIQDQETVCGFRKDDPIGDSDDIAEDNASPQKDVDVENVPPSLTSDTKDTSNIDDNPPSESPLVEIHQTGYDSESKSYDCCEYQIPNAIETKQNPTSYREMSPTKGMQHMYPPVNSYVDINEHNYYDANSHLPQSQYLLSYEENNQEVYLNQHQVMNYVQRTNEVMLPPTTVATQFTPGPHFVYAHPPLEANMGFAQPSEACYPANSSMHMMMHPPNFKPNEQDSQPSFQLIPSSDPQQQPVLLTLTNKLPEQETSGPPVTSYPLSYHHQVDRGPVMAATPAIVGIANPHGGMPYQLPGAPSWGCWPQVALYTTPVSHLGMEDMAPKYSIIPNDVPMVAHHNSEGMNPSAGQPFYATPANFVHVLPNQLYMSYGQQQQQPPLQPQSQPVVHHQMYSQFGHGRSSVLSQDTCSTPGFPSDTLAKNYTNPEMGCFEDACKNRINARSPKTPVMSRAASNSGSSRTTPQTGNPQMMNQNVPEMPCYTSEPNYYSNCHYLQANSNCFPCHYSYGMLPATFIPNVPENFQPANHVQVSQDDAHNKKGNEDRSSNTKVFPRNAYSPNPQSKYGFPQRNSENVNPTNKHPKVGIDEQPRTDHHDQSNVNADTLNCGENKFQNKLKDRKKFPKYNQAGEVILDDNKTEYNNNNNNTIVKLLPAQVFNAQRFDKTPVFPATKQEVKVAVNLEENLQPIRNDRGNLPQRSHVENAQSSTADTKPANKLFLTNDSAQNEGKMIWKKIQSQKENAFHNFPKNLNRSAHRRPTVGTGQYYERERYSMKGNTKEIFDFADHKPHLAYNAHQSFSSNHQRAHHPSSVLQKNRGHPNGNVGLLPLPTPLPNNIRVSKPADGFPPTNPGRGAALDPCLTNSILGVPVPQSGSFYQGAQTVHANLGLMQTSLQGQSALLFRQAPNWIRRLPGQGVFGPPPTAAGQARPRPPRHGTQRFSYR